MNEPIGQDVGPTNSAEYFGMEAKALRDALGLSQEAFADVLHYKQAQISKVESGAVLASDAFAKAMDRVAKTPGVYARLRERLSRGGHPSWFIPYLNLEKIATAIEDYSNALIMGMLQTPEYAEGTFRAVHPRESDDQIKRRVEAHLRRRDVMDRETPPLLWVILHESALRTVVGNRTIMADQLNHLAAVTACPHITLQVLRFTAGAPASSLPFTLLTPDDGATVLYSETREQGHVTDSTAAVSTARATYERLRAAAMSPDESVNLFREIAEEYTR
ncbi:helix-turn-helix domain-containing protein [Streptomyces varsoviensis]|uniref:helix-turn-helix domain-containing protein n=1 Tax=Streptomyces varsoviensis TaxID=67373 RepID=UPI00066212A8|nr:helix-turn-helix transcriptional regulator [Streptomyces varsoviensis]